MYSAHALVDGFPGRSSSHGAFGWSSVWLLQGGGRVVLVETGPPSYIPLLTAGLAQLDLEPRQVTDVLITHAHWDHLSNITMFPDATKWIGAAELRWAEGVPADAPFVSQLHVRELLQPGAGVGRVHDGQLVMPGITALATPGHTPGHLAFLVQTDDGSLIFAGDAVKNVHELSTLKFDFTMDAAASRRSAARLRSLMKDTGAALVPGHDVLLQLSDDHIMRTAAVGAQISFVADAGRPTEDRTISADDPAAVRDRSGQRP
jgi:glyoxylase-like metal-dependent hydrolase (beta-lactamase superfamily II)